MGGDMDDQPAFPLNTPKWHESVSDAGFDHIDFTMGMTLRDYFAAKAMQSYCSDPQWRIDIDQPATARVAYDMADAMMKARDGD